MLMCGTCRQSAERVRIRFDEGKRIESCNRCETRDAGVLLFNYEPINCKNGGVISAAHLKDIRSRRLEEDWSDPGNPKFQTRKGAKPVFFDMAGRR